MEEFSAQYRKMCEKAAEIQDRWEPQDWDDYCRKGDYRDGLASQVHLGIIAKEEEEKEDLKKNHIWLPKESDLEIRYMRSSGIPGIDELRVKRYTEFLGNKEKVEKVKGSFKKDNIGNVLALMFVMEDKFDKEWDFEKQDWVSKKNR